MGAISAIPKNLGFLFLICFLIFMKGCGSQGFNGNPGEEFSAVIGQEIKLFRSDGQPFQEPLLINLLDNEGGFFLISHYFSGLDLAFRVPPGISTGSANVQIHDGSGVQFETELKVKRLGVLANRGGDNLKLFNVDQPNEYQNFSLQTVQGVPEDVSISKDGRFAQVALSNPPGLLTLDLTQVPPMIVSDLFDVEELPSSIAISKDINLAFVANYGSNNQTGNTVELFVLDSEGKILDNFTSLIIGNPNDTIISKPYGIALFEDVDQGIAEAWVTIRNIGEPYEMAKINYWECLVFVFEGCAVVENFNLDTPIPELSGIAIHPQGEYGLIARYDNDRVGIFPTEFGGGTVPIEWLSLDSLFGFGQYRPISVLITPDGNTAYVLNELNDSLVVFDLSQGIEDIIPHEEFPLVALSGEKPRKMALSKRGKEVWISFHDSNEIQKVTFTLDQAVVSGPLPINGINEPGGIAIQP